MFQLLQGFFKNVFHKTIFRTANKSWKQREDITNHFHDEKKLPVYKNLKMQNDANLNVVTFQVSTKI